MGKLLELMLMLRETGRVPWPTVNIHLMIYNSMHYQESALNLQFLFVFACILTTPRDNLSLKTKGRVLL